MGAGRVPGPVGLQEGGSVGKTGGPTGRSGNRTAHTRGPAGAARPTAPPKAGSTKSSTGTTQRTGTEFKEALLRRQVARALAQGKVRFPPIENSDLETIEEDFRMRKQAAPSCRRLLADARAALAAAKASGDARAQRTRSIGLCSAYRTYEYEGGLWNRAFDKQFKKMIKKGMYVGNEHGRGAETYLFWKLIPLKAAPGFSNHSDGRSVDFATSYAGEYLVADSDQITQWRESWLYRWLVENAAQYRFKQLPSEQWHWDYMG